MTKICDQCKLYGGCDRIWKDSDDPMCVSFTKRKTNGDHVRAMTDEELTKFLTEEKLCEIVCGENKDYCYGDCDAQILAWMKREADDGCSG